MNEDNKTSQKEQICKGIIPENSSIYYRSSIKITSHYSKKTPYACTSLIEEKKEAKHKLKQASL